MKIISAIIISFLFTIVAYSQTPGSVDESFECGWHANRYVYSVEMQPDGKILIAGNFQTFDDYASQGVVRLNSDLTVDVTFLSGTNLDVYCMLLEPDGKIIVAGAGDNKVERLNPDGSIDPTFANGSGFSSYIYDMAKQSDGKILVVGQFTQYDGFNRNHIARLNSNGTVDNTFSVGSGTNMAIDEVAIQSDDKILIGGDFTKFQGATAKRIARLNSSGNLDPTFVTGSGFDDGVEDILVQPDGKILVSGWFNEYKNEENNGIIRLLSSGNIDTGFDIGTGADGAVGPMKRLADGRIMIAGGFFNFNGIPCSGYIRLNANGSIDNTFLTFPVTNSFSSGISSLTIQPDGKIIMAGGDFETQGILHSKFGRINADGTAEGYSIKESGFDISLLSSDLYQIHDLVLQPDGKIIAGGHFYGYKHVEFPGLARINADGSADATFIVDGDLITDDIDITYLQNDGKIVLGGFQMLVRLYSDGSVDPGFTPTALLSIPGFHPYSIFELPDHKLIVGTLSNYGDEGKMLYRLNSSGSIDPLFHSGVFYEGDRSYNSILLSDGKILVCGYLREYDGNSVNGIIRLNSDGTYDPTFNIGIGPSYIGNDEPWDAVEKLILQPDGNILVLGNFTAFNGILVNGVVRLFPDGSMDESFNAPLVDEIEGNITQIDLMFNGKIMCDVDLLFDEIQSPPHYFHQIIRLNSDGSVDDTFESAITSGWTNAFIAHPNGDIIAAGNLTNYGSHTKNAIVWMHGDPFVCISPDGLFADHLAPTKAKVHWNSVPSAIKYQVYYRPVGAGAWLKKTSTGNYKNLMGLIPNTIYEFKVRTDCGDGYTAFSSIANFTTPPLRSSSIPEFEIQVFPNPANYNLNIVLSSISGIVNLEITNINGEVMMYQQLNFEGDIDESTTQLNISELARGIYFVKIQTIGNLTIIKFIKS